KAELLEVLDNPARVWDAVLTNLAPEPRMSLLVLTTCTTPCSLVSWQAALARVSPDAAMRFEVSLRVLDDSFVRTFRTRGRVLMADFRNPSMDDFCAGYLDKNVGIATNVASHDPELQQIERLVQLGSALAVEGSHPRRRRPQRYQNIYEALISDPSI